MPFLTSSAAPFTPIWPYIVGGFAAIFTVLIGGWRMYRAWRTDIETEAEKKLINTRALEDNTSAARANSDAIADLTQRFSIWERFVADTTARLNEHGQQLAEHGQQLTQHGLRLDVLEKTPRPRGGSRSPRRATTPPEGSPP